MKFVLATAMALLGVAYAQDEAAAAEGVEAAAADAPPAPIVTSLVDGDDVIG